MPAHSLLLLPPDSDRRLLDPVCRGVAIYQLILVIYFTRTSITQALELSWLNNKERPGLFHYQ
tara:strand:+ start:572 stop:760 length:189 start_codon:yes stop_codon:yes gene_type:complete